MSEWKRLIYYLILNIIVSAATTFAVLIIWEKTELSKANLLHFLPLGKREVLPTVVLPTLSSKREQKTQLPQKIVDGNSQENIILTQNPAYNPTSNMNNSIITIEAVIGAGDLTNEKVRIKRTQGEGDLSLENWRLQGEKEQVYIFPRLILHKGGAVDVYTTSGVDTVIALYWGKNEAVWHNGSVVTLVDEKGNIQASYQVP